jgi:chromosome partitioning protein
MQNSKVLAAVNQKGGVGKSNLCTNLGIGLARHGKKVLVVDCDCQASQTVSLGWQQPDELPVTLATQLACIMENRPFDPQAGVLHHAEGIDLMPASLELSGLELRMVNAMSREFVLRAYLQEVKQGYDFVILDCPPTLGMVTINALSAADSVIVPVQPEFLSVVGMTQLFDTVAQVKRQINPSLQVEGVLITLANMRTNLAKNSVEIIRNAYGASVRVYPEPIPYSVKVKESGAAGQKHLQLRPGRQGSQGLRAFDEGGAGTWNPRKNPQFRRSMICSACPPRPLVTRKFNKSR